MTPPAAAAANLLPSADEATETQFLLASGSGQLTNWQRCKCRRHKPPRPNWCRQPKKRRKPSSRGGACRCPCRAGIARSVNATDGTVAHHRDHFAAIRRTRDRITNSNRPPVRPIPSQWPNWYKSRRQKAPQTIYCHLQNRRQNASFQKSDSLPSKLRRNLPKNKSDCRYNRGNQFGAIRRRSNAIPIHAGWTRQINVHEDCHSSKNFRARTGLYSARFASRPRPRRKCARCRRRSTFVGNVTVTSCELVKR